MSKQTWLHCNNCSGNRKHDLLYHDEVKWSEEIDEIMIINGSTIYDLFKCCGCDTVVLRHSSWNTEDLNMKTGKFELYTRFYPPPAYTKLPSWLSDFSLSNSKSFIFELMREINIALQNDAPCLATMGIRSLLEQIMIDKVGDNGNFKSNLNKFCSEGYITPIQKKVIEPILDAGHATTHRGFMPEKTDVQHLLSATLSIIEGIYVNEFRLRGVADKIPPRPKTKKI